MPEKIKTELIIEDVNGNKTVAYPFVESEHVVLENGMNIDSMIGKDISTPTTEYEELSFKVDSSAVDSSVSKMTIKGQTYQNILPEPSLHNSMKNGNIMQKFNAGYDGANVVDGVVKSAILSGQTLVNLIEKPTSFNMGTTFKVQGGGACIYELIDNGVKISNTKDGSMVLDYNDLTLFKPNTEYTLFVNVNWNGIGQQPFLSKISSAEFKLNNGFNIIKFTSASDLTLEYMCFRLGYAGSINSGCEYTFSNIMIIEGDYTDVDIPYFNGMQSVKMPVLSSIGKNLFDVEKLEGFHENIEIVPNGIRVKNSEIDITRCFTNPFKENTQYTTSFNHKQIDGVGREGFRFYYTDGTNSYIIPNSNSSFVGSSLPNKTIKSVSLSYNTTGTSELTYIQIEEGSVGTVYEPHKSNILSLSEEVVLRSLPNGVKDTYNIVTKEYVQRIGEVVFDGSSDETWKTATNNGKVRFDTTIVKNLKTLSSTGSIIPPLICNRYNTITFSEAYSNIKYGITQYENTHIVINSDIQILEDFLSSLQSNPITVQYELATPVVKTVDLSSFGNHEKVVLNGGEVWLQETAFTHNTLLEFRTQIYGIDNLEIHHCDRFSKDYLGNEYGERIAKANSTLYFRVLKSKLTTQDVNGFKQYLQQNPITVWYQTNTSQANSIKEMLSFANGHIQLSSGVGEGEYSLIPSLDYEVPTSNSYHMDLMKTNAVYTIKCENPTGQLVLNNPSKDRITPTTNRTFSVGNGIVDNLFTLEGSWTNPMILEGDLTSKTLPYFKGIKSAFEDESKIEVLLTGKNLFDGELQMGRYTINEGIFFKDDTAVCTVNKIKVRPSTTYTLTTYDNIQPYNISEYDNGVHIKAIATGSFVTSFTTSAKTNEINISFKSANLGLKAHLIQGVATSYEPFKSNSVKIPLLSPLRSLPNGIRDEIVLDRENNKAKIIQRVGKVVFDGTQRVDWTSSYKGINTMRFDFNNSLIGASEVNTNVMICDKFCGIDSFNSDVEGIRRTSTALVLRVVYDKLATYDSYGISKWLSLNPTTVYYELATPIITEVDLNGYPYIFKDGHIFLNGEIAPKTEIKYSINQSHVIESQNQDVLRHEKEIDYLYKLIGEYVRADYTSTLMTLNLELK